MKFTANLCYFISIFAVDFIFCYIYENTMQRELAPLQAIQDYYPKYLLTLDNDPVVLHNGIKQMYVIDWLLQN